MMPYSSPGHGICRGEHCAALIRWARHETTREWMPLDEHPNTEGNVVLVPDPGPVEICRVLGPLEILLLADEVRYMPHHATCPDYLEFRKHIARREASR